MTLVDLHDALVVSATLSCRTRAFVVRLRSGHRGMAHEVWLRVVQATYISIPFDCPWGGHHDVLRATTAEGPEGTRLDVELQSGVVLTAFGQSLELTYEVTGPLSGTAAGDDLRE